MDTKRLTGPQAGSLKYDILTAMSVAGLHGKPGFQTTMLRLIALVTARYNWRADELSVGQRDMARMWGVNERTVKREVKRLTATGILVCKRQGVRGRVGAYRLDLAVLHQHSKPYWPNVGPDFVDRMQAQSVQVESRVVNVDFSRPSVAAQSPEAHDPDRAGAWRRVSATLAQSEPDLFKNWFSVLRLMASETGVVRLRAPNKFVARYVETHLLGKLTAALEDELGPVTRVVLEF